MDANKYNLNSFGILFGETLEEDLSQPSTRLPQTKRPPAGHLGGEEVVFVCSLRKGKTPQRPRENICSYSYMLFLSFTNWCVVGVLAS